MTSFRERNSFLIYLVNFSGLYLKSIETLVHSKWVLYFFRIYTKIAITSVPVYIGSAIKYLAFDEGPFIVKMSVFRRLLAFIAFFYKNIFFYANRKKIEDIIDLWESYFRGDLFPKKREEKLDRNGKVMVKVLVVSWVVTLTASLIYTIPPFFAQTKKLTHPSGIPYREESPDYELMVAFDFFRVVSACLSGVALDCILMVLLSHVVVELDHLRDSLREMINDISIDANGYVIVREADTFSTPREYSKSNNLSFYSGERERKFSAFSQSNLFYEKAIKDFEVKMRIWILHHQQTIKFFQRIKTLFTPVASLQLVYVVFYTCFTAFHLAKAKVGLDVFVIPFVAASNLISLYVWCQIGVYVDAISSDIFGEAFSRAWFLFPKKIQTAFSIITMRQRKPLTLRGISLFDLNLFTLFQVFKLTYQLFAFMMQVSGEH